MATINVGVPIAPTMSNTFPMKTLAYQYILLYILLRLKLKVVPTELTSDIYI